MAICRSLKKIPSDWAQHGGTAWRGLLGECGGGDGSAQAGAGDREQPQPRGHRPARDEHNFLSLSQRPAPGCPFRLFAPTGPPAVVSSLGALVFRGHL